MKDKAYRDSKLKHKLKEKQQSGEKEVVWRLNPEQVRYIEERLHYRVEPCLYEIKTKSIISSELSKSKLLKEIHYKSKKGIKTLNMTLTKKAIELLDAHGVKYKPLKFKIYLTE